MRKVFRQIPLKHSAPVLATIALLLITPQILQNTPPTAKANVTPQIADIGQVIIFDARESHGMIVDYEWIFHDGTIKHGAVVQHAFQKPGIYYVTLIVTADNGLTDLTTVKVVVRNDPPKAKITANTIAYEGEEITFDATQTLDSDIDLPNLKYYWDLGDGYVAEGKIVSYIYRVSGTYTVTLRVEDDQGFIDTETIYVTILNKPPEANAEANKVVVYEGEEIHFYGYAVDTEYENLTYLWDFGEGTYAFTKDATHTYWVSGVYTVEFMVRDEEGEISSDTITVEVINKPPTVSIKQKNIVVEEGRTIIVEADIEDTPTDIPLITYEWSNGAGGWRRPYIWPDDWSGEIWVRATDDDGAISTDRATVRVVNVDPEASIIDCYAIANITFRVAGAPNATIEVRLLRDNRTIMEANITRIHSEPENISLMINGKLDLTSTWIVEARYIQNYPPCGSNPAWVIMEFSNGAWRKIHHVFNPEHNETYEWRVILNDYIIKPFPEIHEYDCGYYCGYDLEHYGDPEIYFVGKGFDRGMDNLTFLWYVNNTPAVMEEYEATEYPMLAESTFSWEIGYPTNISLRVVDDDGGHSKTCMVRILKQNTTMMIEGMAGRIEIVNYTDNVEEYGIFYATTNATENTTIVWMLDGDTLYGPSITYVWNESGTYIVRIYRNISGELAFLDAVKVEVYNVPPEILEPRDVVLDEGAPINFALSAIDTPNDKQKLRILWIFPQGYRDANITTDYIFWRSGTHTITLYAVDDDGAVATINVSIDVMNKPPTAEKKEYMATMDKSIVMTCVASDTPYDKFYLQYRWVIGDETIVDGYDTVYTFTKPGDIQVKVFVTDDDGDSVETSINVTVENPPPIINILEEIIYYGPHVPIPINTTTVDTPAHEGGVTVKWTVYYDGQAQYQDHQTKIWVRATGQYVLVVTAIDPGRATTQKTLSLQVTLDDDGDGLTNELEEELQTNPNAPDTDGDYLLDPEEIEPGKDGYVTDPTNPDTDGDGLYDGYSFNGVVGELSKGTSPVDNDTDDDQLSDGLEVFGWDIVVVVDGEEQTRHVTSEPTIPDSDSDGLNDATEYAIGTDPSIADTDNDGLSDYDEVNIYKSNPTNTDTDGDGLRDGDEVSLGSSPTDSDSDDDGLSDLDEIFFLTDPMDNDTDDDGLEDGEECSFDMAFEAEWFCVGELTDDGDGVVIPGPPTDETFQKLVEFTVYDVMDVYGWKTWIFRKKIYSVGAKVVVEAYAGRFVGSLKVRVESPIKVSEYYLHMSTPYGGRFERILCAPIPVFLTPDTKIIIYGFRELSTSAYLDKVLIGEPTYPTAKDTDLDGIWDGREKFLGTSPICQDTDRDCVKDLFDANPLGDAKVTIRVLKLENIIPWFGVEFTFISGYNVCIVTSDPLGAEQYSSSNDVSITFDVPDNTLYAGFRIEAKYWPSAPPRYNDYIDISPDSGTDRDAFNLDFEVNIRYGYRLKRADGPWSWYDDYTEFAWRHPVNDPSTLVLVTITDESGYGYASGEEDGCKEEDVSQGRIAFETRVSDVDEIYWFVLQIDDTKAFISHRISDGLPFWLEANYTHTSPGKVDTDGNGVSDAWEDSDGDGVFNIQELIIGKNPGERDIMGIELRVAIDFYASKDYIKHLEEAIKLAIQYIYDYTDGYVFISNVTIVNNVPESEFWKYNMLVKWENILYGKEVPGFAGVKFYDGEIATISISGKILTDSSPWYSNKPIQDRIKWLAAVIGHEFAHATLCCEHEDAIMDCYVCGHIHDVEFDIIDTRIKERLRELGISSVTGFWDPPFNEEIYYRELSWYYAYVDLTRIIHELNIIYGGYFLYVDSGGDYHWGILYPNVTYHWYRHAWEGNFAYGFQWYTTLWWLTTTIGSKKPIIVQLWLNGQAIVFTGLHDDILQYEPLSGPFNDVTPYIFITIIW